MLRHASRLALSTLALAAGSATAQDVARAPGLLGQADAFAAALRARFGRDTRVLELSVSEAGADVQVQDPALPANVDRYTFEDGLLGAPEPVPVGRSRRALEARLFALAEVDLKVLERVLKDAERRAATPEGRVLSVRIERIESSSDYSSSWSRPQLQVVVNGPRGGAVVRYELSGKHRGTSRW